MRLSLRILSLVSAGAASLAASSSLWAAAGDPWRVHALMGATVVVSPGKTIERATIVVRDGVIEAIGPDVVPPPDARVWNCGGKQIFPGLIDAWVGASRLGPESGKKSDAAAVVEPNAPRETPRHPGASHALASVRPELELAETLTLAPESLEKLRNLGFVAAAAVPESGIFRGQPAVVSLGGETVNRSLLASAPAQVVAFETQNGEYPGALMGVIAVIRQSLLDARWHRDAVAAWSRRPSGRPRPEASRALESLEAAADGRARVLFDAGRDPLNVLRAATIGREAGLDLAVLGTGAEYHRLDEIAATRLKLILPLDFPEPPRIGEDEAEWALVSTEELRHWQRAAANPKWLHQAGLRFALSTAKLGDPATFPERLRRAIDAGLPRKVALAALTTVPAELLGLTRVLGSLESGKVASFIVSDGDLFAEDTRIEEVWVEGKRFEVAKKASPRPPADVVGSWLVAFAGQEPEPQQLLLELSRDEAGELTGSARPWPPDADARRITLRCAVLEGSRLYLRLEGARFAHGLDSMLVADVTDEALTGWLDAPGPVAYPARATRLGGGARARPRAPSPPALAPRPIGGPLAQPAALLVRNATIWTSGPAGVLEGADLVVDGGRIAAVGRGLAAPPGASIIDATGKHVTAGMVDAHSHTAISGDVNECTQSVTAEVRIGDVVNPEDVDLYSQLAGGTTAASQLHGSCNAIGGQSQTIKLRWGAGAEGLKLAGAKPGIKFALGENVKQSNWGDRFTVRYPQTRMGVEQVIRERFLAARDYQRKQREYRDLSKTDPDAIPPQQDLELDALSEILNGDRLIHCHSYRQSELMMMLALTREFGVTIGTFQHVLDGYKVADEMAAQGVGASTFTDWWTFKFEVYDAIPWNGALMWDRGVVVSFNSDSNDVARRLNSEAAKAVKYGGLPEAEALKMVTINPARQLRIEDRVGSLEAGKDGDFVIWNEHPLAATAHAEETWIEGKKYFDRDADLELRLGLEAERRALIAQAQAVAKERPLPVGPGGGGYRPGSLDEGHSCHEQPMADRR